MLSRAETERILDRVMALSSADETEATLSGRHSALTRFAENAIHQNVEERDGGLTVWAILGRRIGAASTNRLDDEAIRRAIRDAVEIARFAPEDANPLPRIGPQTVRKVAAYDAETAPEAFGPESRADAAAGVVEEAKGCGLKMAGAFSNEARSYAVANSEGVFAYYRGTSAEFSVTAMGEGTSGWAQQEARSVAEIEPHRAGQIAIEKAQASRNPREVEPGEHTVVLEPAAVEGLVGWLGPGFNALEVDEGRSFLTGKVGTKIAGENITLYSDPYHPLHQGAPFDEEGMPKKRLTLIERGVAKDSAYDRATAKREGVEPTGHSSGGRSANGARPSDLVFEGGEASLEEMIRSTKRGILVTRFWYENLLDRMRLIVTGMTRDGLFWIEDGEVRYAIKNLRFNQSVLELLNHVEMMSEPVSVGGMVVPGMKVEGFHFTRGTAF